jgi:hypothetical protein
MTKEIIEIPLEKIDWEQTIVQNKNLIRTNQLQIIMASEIIRMCEKKLEELSKAEKKESEAGIKKLVG